MAPLRRLLACSLAGALVGLAALVVAPRASAAPCGDGSLSFSGGEGTAESPYLISTQADLVALRGGYTTTPSYYSCDYRQVNDITLTGTWPHGIGFSTPGSALYKPFNGTYDGDGYALANLTIDASGVVRASQGRELGFVGLSTSGTAAVRNLDLANASVTCGFETVDAGLLVAQTSGAVSRSSATGSVVCTAADGLARLGGLIGYTDGSVANAWVSGSVTAPTAFTFSPNAIGGAIGTTGASSSVVNIYSRVTIVNPASAVWTGIAVGRNNGGALTSSYAQSGLTAGSYPVVGVGLSTGLSLKTSAELQDITTFTGWSIAAGIDTSRIWGIDPAVNSGYPFLQDLPAAPFDPSQAPAPILQQLPMPPSGSCAMDDDTAYGYGTAVRGGWTPSWAVWANGGTGGPVCGRTLVYLAQGWTVAGQS